MTAADDPRPDVALADGPGGIAVVRRVSTFPLPVIVDVATPATPEE